MRSTVKRKCRPNVSYPDSPTCWKAFCFIVVITFVLLGCSRRDPIDRVMDRVSNESAPSYLFVPVQLPATATPEQLVSALKVRGEFGQLNIYSGSVKIVETRSIHHALSIPEAYTAVLLDTNLGRRMVLFEPLSSKSKWGGWYWRIYDA